MSCMGTLLGATIGMFLGGPLGAIAGAAFASLASSLGSSTENFRMYEDPYGNLYGQRLRPHDHARLTFFVGAFSLLAKLASADGEVSRAEREKVEEFMNRDLNLDPASRASAERIFEAALHSGESFHRLANQFYQEFYMQPQFFELLIDVMLRVSAADTRGITSEEETLILDAVHIFRMSDERYQQLKSRYVRQSSSSYAVLGCSPSDSDDQIKRSYRRLVSEYHPDKIASRGLPEEFQQLASDKFREIQAAYEQIVKERQSL